MSGLAEKKEMQLSDDDQQLLLAIKKWGANVIYFKGGNPTVNEEMSDALLYAKIMDICKCSDPRVAIQIIVGAAAGQGLDTVDANLSVALRQIMDLKPETTLEAMLVGQMVAVNAAISQVVRQSASNKQTLRGKQNNINLATKLHRTFLRQVEALQKLRGKGQQTVRVEHVTVNSGGSAVVGHIDNHQGGGRGE